MEILEYLISSMFATCLSNLMIFNQINNNKN